MKELKEVNENSINFMPTPHMIKFLEGAIELGTYRDITEVARLSSVDRTNWYKWLKVPDFLKWFSTEFIENLKSRTWELDAIGWEKAKKDFRYWEAMQKKYCGLKDEKQISDTRVLIQIIREEKDAISGERIRNGQDTIGLVPSRKAAEMLR